MDGRKTRLRGLGVLNSPLLNKGTAFPAEERKALGLIGLLPPEITTLDVQVRRAYLQYSLLPDSLSKNVYLTALHDRNEVLFFRLFSEHLREMIPIVNNLTVGLAMEQYRHECRPPRGVYLSINHPDSIDEAFASLGLTAGDVDLVLATDAEHILGIGDWGLGGIEVPIGKLAIYTAAGGVDPSRVIPVMLDVGTDRESLLNDPMYVGNRHPRVRGDLYDAFIDRYVAVVSRLFPHALLQWEDFAPGNGRRILARYRNRLPVYNDDMQGPGAIVLAAVISAVRLCRTPLRHLRVIVFGAGTAGIGVADQVRDAMIRDGLSEPEATERFWCVDKDGLLASDMDSQLSDFQVQYARHPGHTKGWARELPGGGIALAEVVRRVRPNVLIGASGVTGGFTEPIVRQMAAGTERPVVIVLSNPASRAEANPADLLTWTDGRALVASGGAFPPVTYKGVTHVIAELNNSMLYPGLALGAIVARASGISGGMLVAAASAVSSLVTVRHPGASLLPHIDDLRIVSLTVATAVAEAAVAEGLAGTKLTDIARQVQDAMWQPRYRALQAI